MAFGFSPKYSQDFIFDGLDKAHFLVLAHEAAHKLDWNVGFVSENGFVAYTKFSWSSWSEEVTVTLDHERATIKSECTGSQLMDWGKNKENVHALLAKIEKVRPVLTPDEMELKFAELRQGFAPAENDVLSKPPLTAKEKITDFFSILKPTDGYFVAPILLIVNVLVFVAMLVSGVHILMPESQDLINWGANFRPVTLEGGWWRLLTACFLHIGILHLLLNMYALLYIGLLLEPYLGKARFLAAYLISGIAASVTSLWWHDLTISAGASGAIFGMYGVFLALLTTNLLDKSVKKAMLASIAVFVGYNLLNGLKPNGGIDNAAHIGGLLSGLVIGYAFVPSLKQYDNKPFKFLTIGALSMVLLVSSSFVYKALPNDIGKYDSKIEEFVSNETKALHVFRLPEGTPNGKILTELKERGLYYWAENLKLIESCETLDLPLPLRTRNRILKEYCQLRIESYELIYKAISEDTNRYEEEIKGYNVKIEGVIKQLSDIQ